MKNNLILLFSIFFVLALSGIVYAASDKDEISEENIVTTSADATAVKNMTYGQCVSQNAKIRNTCYDTVKGTLNTCREQAAQDPAKKDADKKCKQDYKRDKKECKTAFKNMKKGTCAQIKHNFFETMRYAFE